MVAIDVKHVKTLQYTVENGITEPKFGMLADNSMAIIKPINGPEGNLVLFNEIFCYKLAILLGLPMPNSGICIIDKNTDVFNKCLDSRQYGYGFYSQFLNKAIVLVPTIISKLKNIEVFFMLLLFDHIIFNTDRNSANLLVQYYKKDISLKVIDHTHVFVNQAVWDSTCLKRCIEKNDYNSTDILVHNNFLYEMFYQQMNIKENCFDESKIILRKHITESTLRIVSKDIPEEWLPSSDDLEALIEYILYRVRHLDEICKMIDLYINERKEIY